MKKLIISLTMVLISTMCFAQNDAFKSFTEHFGKTAAFAYANISNHEVLLVSHEVFGNDEENGLKAVAASIFALDKDGKIVSLGSVRSQGTLYPVSVLDNKLMVAGHNFVNIYEIRGEEPELVLSCHEEGDCESPKLKAMFKTFEEGKAIVMVRK
ncbi:MAG: hypothetical protein HUK07_04695 [Bacteroidaceae bacterium]|nr:hypothetical protein [Bacteroidaceae bacterium]